MARRKPTITLKSSTFTRLRAQKQDAEHEAKQAETVCRGNRNAKLRLGYETGKAWTEDHATLDQLEMIACYGGLPANYRGADAFWQESVGLTGDDLELADDKDWLNGFFGGVLDVWQVVKDCI